MHIFRDHEYMEVQTESGAQSAEPQGGTQYATPPRVFSMTPSGHEPRTLTVQSQASPRLSWSPSR
jgi:hypothetical protein